MDSKYQPQLSCWREDLRKGVYTTKLPLTNNKKLRYANDDYCEFSRQTVGMRTITRSSIIFFSVVLLGIGIGVLGMLIYFLLFIDENKVLLTCFIFILIICFQAFSQVLLNFVFSPFDCPIRFNRKTGKVYIYDHFILYLGSWSTFIRSPFRAKEITVKEFNWKDVQGVMTSVSAPIANGGMVRNYRIECVVCEPNTTYVIDHFLLDTASALNYDVWMWINSYMAFSDNNLDAEFMPEEEFPWPIKVNWPEEIDKKSKASSLEEYQRIDDEYKKIKED